MSRADLIGRLRNLADESDLACYHAGNAEFTCQTQAVVQEYLCCEQAADALEASDLRYALLEVQVSKQEDTERKLAQALGLLLDSLAKIEAYHSHMKGEYIGGVPNQVRLPSLRAFLREHGK